MPFATRLQRYALSIVAEAPPVEYMLVNGTADVDCGVLWVFLQFDTPLCCCPQRRSWFRSRTSHVTDAAADVHHATLDVLLTLRRCLGALDIEARRFDAQPMHVPLVTYVNLAVGSFLLTEYRPVTLFVLEY